MIIYRDQRARADTGRLLQQLHRDLERLDFHGSTYHEDTVDALIAAGVLESAVADAVFPSIDDIHPLISALRRVTVALGHVSWHSWRRDRESADLWRSNALALLHHRGLTGLPSSVWVSIPEGYGQYGVYPEAYLEAAKQAHSELALTDVVCIGLRSIGSSLFAVVAAALEELGCRVRTLTLRPRGEPFDRRPVISPELQKTICQGPPAHFLLVDEGPGISGSSLGGTAEMLSQAGIPDSRIVLFPSHVADSNQLRSTEAQDHWRRHRQFSVSFEDLWDNSDRRLLSIPLQKSEDFSAGAWRSRLLPCESDFPPVQPQHERRKYLLRTNDSKPLLASFFGLGRPARSKLDRAHRLAATGLVPSPEGTTHGFLIRRFIAGQPLRPNDTDQPLLETMAQYLNHLSREHQTEPTVSDRSLTEMTLTNIGQESGELSALLSRFPLPVEAGWAERPVALDGRMQAHEWIRTEEGYLKVDAFDHHDDHFLPGCQDIAWDLAGAIIELELEPTAASYLIRRYRALSGDRGIGARLPHYTLAYLAFRLGYCRLAASVLGETPDGIRFRGAAESYRAGLRHVLTSHSSARTYA